MSSEWLFNGNVLFSEFGDTSMATKKQSFVSVDEYFL